MKCALCGKAMFTASAWGNGRPIGPVCAKRYGLVQQKRKQNLAVRIEDRQIDLFEERNDRAN